MSSMYQDAYDAEVYFIRRGEWCKGRKCTGWHASSFDIWHECPCNSEKGIAHPESDYGNAYVITVILDGEQLAVRCYNHMDLAQESARAYTKSGWKGVRLRRIEASPYHMQHVEAQMVRARTLNT